MSILHRIRNWRQNRARRRWHKRRKCPKCGGYGVGSDFKNHEGKIMHMRACTRCGQVWGWDEKP